MECQQSCADPQWKCNPLLWCFHVWHDRASFLWGKQPGHYCGFWVLLKLRRKMQRAINVWFQQGGVNGQAKHDFSWGNCSRVLNFTIYWHSLTIIFPRLKSLGPFPVWVSEVYSECYSPPLHSTTEGLHYRGIRRINGGLLQWVMQNFRQWL